MCIKPDRGGLWSIKNKMLTMDSPLTKTKTNPQKLLMPSTNHHVEGSKIIYSFFCCKFDYIFINLLLNILIIIF